MRSRSTLHFRVPQLYLVCFRHVKSMQLEVFFGTEYCEFSSRYVEFEVKVNAKAFVACDSNV